MATGGKLGRSQIDASDALHDFSCTPCSEDGKNTEALFQCTDCQIFYCQRCVSGHNKFTRNHNVLEKSSKLFGQSQIQQRSSSTSELPTDLCEEHHGEIIKMFCGQHDVVCCTVCIAVKHRSCQGVEYIPNIAKGLLKKQDKNKTKTSLEKVKDDLQNLKSEMQNDLKELNVQRDGILDDIQKFKKRLIAKIEELERKSVKELQDKHKEIADKITTSSKTIDAILKDVEQQLDKLKQSRSKKVAQLFVDIKIGEEKISEGNEFARQAAAQSMETLVFEMNRSIENRLCVQSLGKLTLTSKDDDVGPIHGLLYRCEKCRLSFTTESLLETHNMLHFFY